MKFPWRLVTDQRQCYDVGGRVVPCAGTGQDAEGKSPGPDPAPRLAVQGDTVTDDPTGLCWCRDANRFEFPLTWDEAADRVAEMNRSGWAARRDWRLPSRRELFSLLSHQHVNPALCQGHPFRNVFPGYYWTDTSCARLPHQAWIIHLGGARVYRAMKHRACLVWPVAGPRHEDRTSGPRFRRHGSHFQDLWTGLRWAPAARGPLSWDDALRAAAVLNSAEPGGPCGWRLPNIRELDSLLDLTRHSPALPAGHGFGSVPDGCWSATTSAYEPRYAWVLYPRDGALGVGFKPGADFRAWAVSGAGGGRIG
jgi:hypothetical protein